MALATNPGVVTDGLTFYYDMNNTAKSFVGKPVTNQFAVPTPYNSSGDVSFAINGTGTFRRIYEGTYGGYTIQPNDIVYRYNLSSTGGCHYHGNAASIGAGQYATFIFDYYISQDAASYPYTNFLANFENYGGSALGGSVAAPNSYKGIWQTVSFTSGPTGGTGTQAMFLYPGACGGDLALSGYVLFKNPQCIFSSSSNDTAPFVNGTRSNTQTLLDLTGQNVITAQSLTYASDNTFSFSAASSNYIDSGYDLSWNNTNSASIDFWCRPTTTSQNVGIIGKGSDWEWQVRQNGDAVQFVYWDTGGSHNNGPIPIISSVFAANVWKHIAVVWSHTANQLYIYANGVLISTSNWTNASINANKSNTVKIGGLIYDWLGGGSYWSGSIAAVKLYSIALSPSEVQQNFNALRGRFGL